VRGTAQQNAAAERCWLTRAPALALCAAYPLLSQPNSHFPSLSSYPRWLGLKFFYLTNHANPAFNDQLKNGTNLGAELMRVAERRVRGVLP
jgi:hypothetical protein